MINSVFFKQSIKDGVQLLQDLELYKGKNVNDYSSYSEAFVKASRKNSHLEMFNAAINNLDYEILLFDDSIFQFSLVGNVLRYAFIQNPQIFSSREDFLSRIFTPEDLLSYSDEELEELKGSINEDEYQQFLNEQEFSTSSNLIRYDLDSKGYLPLVHSYSHIHIGMNENLRIPCSKILTPLKFVLFAVKNTYYKEWKNACVNGAGIANRVDMIKKQCLDLPVEFWTQTERQELYLL